MRLACGLLLLVCVSQDLSGQTPDLLPPPFPAEIEASDNANGQRVLDVRVIGNERIAKNRIFAKLKTRPDRPFDPDLLQADAQELMLMKEFRNVRPFVQEKDGGVIVTFEVQEKPRIDAINYYGNRAITDRGLAKETGIKKGDPLDLYSIRLAQQRIEDLYRRKGFPRTEVTVVDGDELSDNQLTFLINEDQVQQILDVEFVGNSFVSGARLASFIKSKPGMFSPFFRSRFVNDTLSSDKERLTAYYRNFGFFNAVIDTEVRYNDDHSKVTVTFVVHEGPRYKVRNVSVAGNKIYSTDDLFTLIELEQGKEFNAGEMTRDVSTLKDLYGSNGYINAASLGRSTLPGGTRDDRSGLSGLRGRAVSRRSHQRAYRRRVWRHETERRLGTTGSASRRHH